MDQQVSTPEFSIQRLYIKDSSYEAPYMPAILTGDWQPTLSVNLQTKAAKFEDNLHEVILIVTVTAKINDKIAFLVEVQQAGVFLLHSFEPAELEQMLNSYCPNILFPYAREFISDTVVRGGFPVLYLAPVNFDVLYQQHLERKSMNSTDAAVTNLET